MREIKFMAWDKQTKDWLELNEFNQWYNRRCGVFRDFFDNHIELLQYTGVKDKEEREVYEGDIYKDEENMLWEVIFDKEDCAYKLENLHTPGRTTIRNVKDMDHVGNIYENPELLEG